jgi:hypothetical protein
MFPTFRLTAACFFFVLLVSSSAPAARFDVAAESRRHQYEERIGFAGKNGVNNVFRAAARVDLQRPIGEYEAFVLASAYFFRQFGPCGIVKLPTRRGDHWVAETLVGSPPSIGARVFVDARTGITYAAGFPRIINPKKYLKSLQNI